MATLHKGDNEYNNNNNNNNNNNGNNNITEAVNVLL